MGKRKHQDDEKILKKIKKLEIKLQKRRRCRVISSSTDDDVMDEETPQCATDLTEAFVVPEVPLEAHVETTLPILTPEPIPSTSNTNVLDSYEEDVILNEEILEILGDAPSTAPKLGKPIHKEIAIRWSEILMKGLPADSKESLLKEYLVPSNCDLLIPPALNLEAKAAVGEAVSKRDYSIMQRQNQVGVTLAALSSATEALLLSNPQQSVLKPLSDACRLLCDMHYNETKTRRNLIITSINTNLKDTLINTSRDKFLFGDNIPEKLKAAKAIQQSGEALKNTPYKPFNKNNFVSKTRPVSKNWKGHRKTPNKPDGTRYQPARFQPPPPTQTRIPRSPQRRRPRPSDDPPRPAPSTNFHRKY